VALVRTSVVSAPVGDWTEKVFATTSTRTTTPLTDWPWLFGCVGVFVGTAALVTEARARRASPARRRRMLEPYAAGRERSVNGAAGRGVGIELPK
jgi:hypothetical protein